MQYFLKIVNVGWVGIFLTNNNGNCRYQMHLRRCQEKNLFILYTFMPRTLKSKGSRSSGYKRNKEQRGLQKIDDRNSHGSNRAANRNANEITYNKFDCKVKFGRGISTTSYSCGSTIPFNPAHLSHIDDYDWKKESFVDYLHRKVEEGETGGYINKTEIDAWKQVTRRGEIRRFVSHGRRYKALDQI